MTRLAVVAVIALMCVWGGESRAQSMPQFQYWLNGQMQQAYRHYNEGVRTYRSVPPQRRLDYKCAHGDQRACYVHQKQLDNANEYMRRHYRNLGSYGYQR